MEIAALLRTPEVEDPTAQSEFETNGFICLNTTQYGHDPLPASNNVVELTNHLQEVVRDVWDNRHGSRYSSVKVMLTQWASDDLGVIAEIEELRRVFEALYRFDVTTYMIPNYQPDRALKRQVIDFVDGDHRDTLLIFYYASHAFLNPARHDSPVWSANRRNDSLTLPSSGIQSLIEEADCDALLLYDTCHSAETATSAKTTGLSSHGVTEIIAACGFEAIAAEVGQHSFTNALCHVLALASEGPALSTSELHGRLLTRLKSWEPSPMRDQNGGFIRDPRGALVKEPQRRRTPVYSRLSHQHSQRRIMISPLPRPEYTNASNLTKGPAEVHDGFMGVPGVPNAVINPDHELVLSIKLATEVSRGTRKPDKITWVDWLCNAPTECEEIRIDRTETVYLPGSLSGYETGSFVSVGDQIAEGAPYTFTNPPKAIRPELSTAETKLLEPLASEKSPTSPDEDGNESCFTSADKPGPDYDRQKGVNSLSALGTSNDPSHIHPVSSGGASHRRGPWSQGEDAYLLQLVHTQGALNWVRIAQLLGSRSPKQCRERYHQNLKPRLNHEPISPEEGVQIERLVGEMGKRWAEIARRLQGRSDNAVKNWWNGSMNRRRRLVLRRGSHNRAAETNFWNVVDRELPASKALWHQLPLFWVRIGIE